MHLSPLHFHLSYKSKSHQIAPDSVLERNDNSCISIKIVKLRVPTRPSIPSGISVIGPPVALTVSHLS
jgi:hypothetical protein